MDTRSYLQVPCIVSRHWATSGGRIGGKFSPGTSLRNLKNMIDETGPMSRLRVVVNPDGTVRTAFPS
jgi:hypothetical protein